MRLKGKSDLYFVKIAKMNKLKIKNIKISY